MPCGTDGEWSRVNVIEELRRVELFAGGQPEALERLARSARIVEFVRDSHVWLEGDESRCLYLLASGQVKVYRSAPTGEEVVAAIYGPWRPLWRIRAVCRARKNDECAGRRPLDLH